MSAVLTSKDNDKSKCWQGLKMRNYLGLSSSNVKGTDLGLKL